MEEALFRLKLVFSPLIVALRTINSPSIIGRRTIFMMPVNTRARSARAAEKWEKFDETSASN